MKRLFTGVVIHLPKETQPIRRETVRASSIFLFANTLQGYNILNCMRILSIYTYIVHMSWFKFDPEFLNTRKIDSLQARWDRMIMLASDPAQHFYVFRISLKHVFASIVDLILKLRRNLRIMFN